MPYVYKCCCNIAILSALGEKKTVQEIMIHVYDLLNDLNIIIF